MKDDVYVKRVVLNPFTGKTCVVKGFPRKRVLFKPFDVRRYMKTLDLEKTERDNLLSQAKFCIGDKVNLFKSATEVDDLPKRLFNRNCIIEDVDVKHTDYVDGKIRIAYRVKFKIRKKSAILWEDEIRSAKTRYHVIAGKYEDNNERNIKYADSFATLEEAVGKMREMRGYPFCELQDDDGNELDSTTGKRMIYTYVK